MAQAEVGKMDKIRVFLEGLVSEGKLDLLRPVPNARLREWARELKKRYNEDFNVHTIGVVLRELRIAYSYKLTEGIDSKTDGVVGSSEVGPESAESAAVSAPSPESDAPNAPGSGSGGDVLPAIALIGGLAAAVAAAVVVSYYLSQNK